MCKQFTVLVFHKNDDIFRDSVMRFSALFRFLPQDMGHLGFGYKGESPDKNRQVAFAGVVRKCFIKHKCFIVLYFHGHDFFLLEIALLCFFSEKMCFFLVNCLSWCNYPLAVLCQDLESIYFWKLFCKFLWGWGGAV